MDQVVNHVDGDGGLHRLPEEEPTGVRHAAGQIGGRNTDDGNHNHEDREAEHRAER